MRIIYISGYGRSGSTILEMSLSQHFYAFGCGELCNLFQSLIHNEHCECGEPIEICSFWSSVLQDLTDGIKDDREEWHKITRKGERLCRGKEDLAVWSHLWRNVLRSISKKSGCDTIIDSSKTTRLNANRIKNLKNLGEQVDEIHLIRHPADVMRSVKKGSNQLIEAGRKNPVRFGGGIRAGISWYLTNYRVMNYNQQVHSYLLPYERFTSEFEDCLTYLENALSLQRRREPWHVGHGISGNRVRRSGEKLKVKNNFTSSTKLNFVERTMAKWLSNVYENMI